MKVFLSYMLRPGLSSYHNEKNISVKNFKNNEVELTMKGHCGTHIDFPFHFDNAGKKADDYNAADFFFDCVYVNEVKPEGRYITPRDIGADIPPDVDFLIFKTRRAGGRFSDSYALANTGLSEEAAKFLRTCFKRLRCVGIDGVSLNAYGDEESGALAHEEFLCKKPEILIVEDLDLSRVGEGRLHDVIAAPLLISGADGAPLSVIAEV